jgi:hypothetical protein
VLKTEYGPTAFVCAIVSALLVTLIGIGVRTAKGEGRVIFQVLAAMLLGVFVLSLLLVIGLKISLIGRSRAPVPSYQVAPRATFGR